MTQTLRVVDDDGNILFDFDDATGANNPSGLKTRLRDFVLEPVSPELKTFDPDVFDGALLLTRRRPLRTATPTMGILAMASHADMVSGFSALQRLLDAGGRIQWVRDSTTRYLRYVGGVDLGSLFRGQQSAGKFLLEQFRDPEGASFPILVQPLLEGSDIGLVPNRLSNPTLLRDSNLDGRPNAWTWSSATGISAESIDAATESYQFTFAVAAARNLQQVTAAGSAAEGDVWTLAFEAACDSALQSGARIEFLDASETSLVTYSGTLVTLGAAFQTLSVTTPAAPANTDHIQVSLRRPDPGNTDPGTFRFRRAKLALSAAVTDFCAASAPVSNDPAYASGDGRWFLGYNPADAPAPMVLVSTADSGAAITDVLAGIRSSGGITGVHRIADLVNETGYAQCDATGGGWTATAGTGVGTTTDTDASGGSVRRVNASQTEYLKRLTLSRTTKLESLRGRVKVYLHVKPTAASTWRIGLVWAPSTGTAAYANEVKEYVTSATTPGYGDVDLGEFYLPDASLGGVSLEIWAQRTAGTGDLWMDHTFHVPIDEGLGHVFVPGNAPQSFLGRELTTPPYKLTADPTWVAGSVVTDDLKLDLVNEAGGAGPNTGLATGAGRWRATFTVSVASRTVATLKVRVVDPLTGSGAGSEIVSQSVSPSGTETYTLEWDGTAGHLYQPEACITAYTQGTVYVKEIEVASLRSIASGQSVRIDGERLALEMLDSTQALIDSLQGSGHLPFIAPPHLFAVPLVHAEQPAAGDPLPLVKITRVPTETLAMLTRHYS